MRVLAVGVAAVSGLSVGTTALASTAGYFGESNNFVYLGEPGERNDIVVGPSESNQKLQLVDSGAVIDPGWMCAAPSPHDLLCSSPFQPYGGVMYLRDAGIRADVQSLILSIDSGAGDDSIRTNAYSVHSGGGSDRLVGTGTHIPERRWAAYHLHAGPGDDILIAGPGSYDLEGGEGTDRLTGGEGNDTLLARDGEPDVVTCGQGDDLVRADGADSVAGDCENVDRRVPGQQTSVPTPKGLVVVTERSVSASTMRSKRIVRFLTVRRRSDGRLVYRARSRRPLASRIVLPPGSYRLSSYVRSCKETCRSRLSAARYRCTRAFELPPAEALTASIRRHAGRACGLRIDVRR